jgi:alpha-galactosidase
MAGDITATFVNETGCQCKTAYCLNTGYAGCSVVTIIQKMREISQYQVPGHWADMDMLEIGNGNMTLAMQQTHFTFWSALKSPLIIGADLTKLNNDSLSVLTNRDIIALNQDPLGVAVNYIESASTEGYIQIWSGPVKGGSVFLVFNEKSYSQKANLSFAKLGLNVSGLANVKELWSGRKWTGVEQVAIVLEPYQTLAFQLS